MNLLFVLERMAAEYGWTPWELRRLTIGQVRAFWNAFAVRWNAQQQAATGQKPSVARPGGPSRAPNAPSVGYTGKPPVETYERADGKTETRYNVLSVVAATRGQDSWRSGTPLA